MLECDVSAPDLDADYPSHASRSSTSSPSNLTMINEHNLHMRAHNAFRVGGGSPARGRKVQR